MSQRLGFWTDCWIYTKRTERDNMKFIIKSLQKHKTRTITKITREAGSSDAAMRVAVLYLLAARVVKVQQHRDAKVYMLNKNWFVNLKKMTTPYSKKELSKSSRPRNSKMRGPYT